MNSEAENGRKGVARPHCSTVAEYRRLAKAGVLAEDARVELIGGRVFEMAHVGAAQLGMINRLGRLLSPVIEGRGILSIHNPVQLDDVSEPRPDVAILRFRADDIR